MLYEKGPVRVDATFARFGSKSYAIGKINSVDVRARNAYGQGLPVLFGIIAFACLMSILTNGIGSGAVLGLLIFGALTWRAWQRHKTLEYSLYLMTSSSEVQALTTCDADEISELREAIETAIAGQHERTVHVHHNVSLRAAEAEPEMRHARTANIRQRLIR